MKTTTVISIPGYIASGTLTELQEKNIVCNYKGIDQSGRLLMEIEFERDLKYFMERIIQDIQEAEKNMAAIQKEINEALEKLFKEKGLITKL